MSRRKPDGLEEVDAAIERSHVQRQQERDRLRRRWEAFSVELIKAMPEGAENPGAYWIIGVNRAIFGLIRSRTVPVGHGPKWVEGMSDYYTKQIDTWIAGVPSQAAHLVPKVREFLKSL